MRWHLVGPDGLVVRSADADSIGEARFRLGGVPREMYVTSAASYQVPAPKVGDAAPGPRVGIKGAHPVSRRKARDARYRARKNGYMVPYVRDCRLNETRRMAVLASNVRGETDTEIAARWGASVSTVTSYRKDLRLPSQHDRVAMSVRAYWTLGLTDSEIAERIGALQPSVSRIRRRLGLPVHYPSHLAPPRYTENK